MNNVLDFKRYWFERYSYIDLNLDDKQIEEFIVRGNGSIEKATDLASDYLLANGLAEVQE